MLEHNITLFSVVPTLLLCVSLSLSLLLGTHRGIGGEHATVTSVMDLVHGCVVHLVSEMYKAEEADAGRMPAVGRETEK